MKPVLIVLISWLLPTVSNASYNSDQSQACKAAGVGRSDNTRKQNCNNEPVFIRDSINSLFKELDTDDNDYWHIDEIIPCVKIHSRIPLGDAEAVDRANTYLNYLDENLDGVIDIYELRYNLHSITTENIDLAKDRDSDFIYWIKWFIGEKPQKYPFSLVQIYQIFDEDLNGKLSWKEIRMTIKAAQLFKSVKEEHLMDERAMEDLVASVTVIYQQKWLNLEELWGLLYKLDVDSDDIFYQWTKDYLGGDSEYKSALVKDSTRKEFEDVDSDSNGVITKGEVTAKLHQARKDYYDNQRINRRWTRADRNKDGVISFNEYSFLENLKHPQRK